MSNNESGNNDLFQSQRGVPQSSKIKHKFLSNLNSSQLFPKDSMQVVPSLQDSVVGLSSLNQKVLKFQREYLKQFQKNKKLNQQLIEVIQERNLLADKYNNIKRTKTTENSVHRKRRQAKDIERLFYCPMQKCKKGYGSEGSLSHHVRLKHLQFYNSGKYEIFVQKYIDSMQETKKKPEKASSNKQVAQQISQSLQKGEENSKRCNIPLTKKQSEKQK